MLENESLIRTEAAARHPEDLDLYARSAKFTQTLQHLNDDDSNSDTQPTPKRIRTNHSKGGEGNSQQGNSQQRVVRSVSR